MSGIQHRRFVVARLGTHSCGDREPIIRYFLTGNVVGGERVGDKRHVLSTVPAMKNIRRNVYGRSELPLLVCYSCGNRDRNIFKQTSREHFCFKPDGA